MKKTKLAICIILCMAIGITLLGGCGRTTTTTATPAKSPAASQAASAAPATSAAPPSSAGVAQPSPSANAKYSDNLNVSIGDKVAVIDIFNPAFGNSQSGLVSNMLWSTLVYCSMDNKYGPALAKSWDTKDYKVYNFKLRNDITFTNGQKFNADDVAFTIDKAKKSTGTGINDKFSQIEKYEIVNDYEINLTLSKVNVDFLYDVSLPTNPIVNRDAYDADPQKGPWVGTGAWTVAEFVPNVSVKFARNDKYFGELPKTKTITFKYIAEETARMIMFENGEFDFCGASATYVPTYQKDPRFVLWDYIMNNTNYIAFNQNIPICADINFRMAVASAFKREDCVAISLGGEGVAAPIFWGYTTQFKNTDIKPLPYDLAKAKEYLAKSSYKGEPIELICAMAHTIKNAQVIQEQMAKIGINCKVFSTDGATLSSNTAPGNNKAQIIVNSGVWSPLASSIRPYLVPGSSSNKANYNNPKVTEMLDQAAQTTDAAAREKLFKQIQEIVNTELPYIGIFNMQLFVAGQKGCSGVLMFANNNHDYSHAFRVKA